MVSCRFTLPAIAALALVVAHLPTLAAGTRAIVYRHAGSDLEDPRANARADEESETAQVVRSVELPLALPLIIGGIPAAIYERFAGVQNDSTETSLWIWLAGTAILAIPAIGNFFSIGL